MILISSLSALILLISATSQVAAICLTTGAPGTLLAQYNDSTGAASCKPGYYCPSFDATNASTYPEGCLPTPQCAVTRLFGKKCDESQGTFEPYVCPAGYYCPTNKGTIITCPEGGLCNVGSTEPGICPPLTVCDGISGSNYGLFIYWGLTTVVMVLLYVMYSRFCLTSELVKEEEEIEDGVTPGAWNNDQALVDGFKRSRGDRPPFRLEFLNLAVSVTDVGTGKTKHILKDMSGALEPGTVTAIMGPSGAGKTTFMMALLGKKDPAWNTKGILLVNGIDQIKQMRHSIGFVPQDDVLHKELSVYKNLYYSSETRLPRDWTVGQKAAFRSSIVESLGLTRHRDTVIGDEHDRGVSGGQRKRASIGVELSAAPLAMFLDEPTSGLDSTTSLEVCGTLKRIAVETNLTVGMVIHQPRVEIWNGLDQVLFIGKGGRVVYQGLQSSAQEYFEQKCNVKFSPDANPADVIIDAVGENSDSLADLWKVHLDSSSLASSILGRNDLEIGEATEDGAVAVSVVTNTMKDTDTGFRGASFSRQLVLSHNRYMEKQLATLGALNVELVVCILCGLVLGYSFRGFIYSGFYVFPFRRVTPYPSTALFPQMNMYAAMSVALGGAPSGVRVFGVDRFSYFREAAAGYSRVAYFLGTLFSVTYRCVWVTLIFASIYHGLAGLPIDFGLFFLSMFLLYWNAYALGMIVSQVVSQRMAPLVSQVLCVCFAVLNGFVGYPVWMKRVAFPFYASQVIMNLWHDLFSHVFEPQFAEWGYEGGTTTSSLWIMFLSSVIFQVIAFLLMVGTNRERQQ